MIKVAFISNNLIYGGIERFYINYLNNYDFKDEYEIDIIYSGKCDEEILNQFSSCGVNIIKLEYGINNKFKYFKELKKLFKEKRYDVIHCNLMQNDYIPLFAGLLRGVKLRISHAHMDMSMKYDGNKKNIFNRLGKRIRVRLSNLIANKRIACSEEAGKKAFGRRFTIIYDAINIDNFKYDDKVRKSIRKSLGYKPHDHVYAFVGRLNNNKNPMHALKVFEAIKNIDKSAKFLIVGDGDLKEEILSIIKKKSKYKQIDPVENINDYYSAMDVLIYPSFTEGLGMVSIEAQCTGLPVVASDNVPRTTKISNYINYLPLKDDVNAWAQVLLSYVTCNRNEIVYNNNYSNYDIKDKAHELFDIYKKK
ncbi:MAG: glycosyltransferase [Bacilli bacterium]|nr:glycosyltransferase [Bacilli bacterium]